MTVSSFPSCGKVALGTDELGITDCAPDICWPSFHISLLSAPAPLLLRKIKRHACNPTLHEPCSWSSHCHGDGPWSGRMRDEDWYDLITEGTSLYDRWVAMMDDISQYLQWLKDEGVEVLFRPLHEMNQGWYGFQRDVLRSILLISSSCPNHRHHAQTSNSLSLSHSFYPSQFLVGWTPWPLGDT